MPFLHMLWKAKWIESYFGGKIKLKEVQEWKLNEPHLFMYICCTNGSISKHNDRTKASYV